MLQHLINWIIQNGGLYMMLIVIFAETGLFVGFFLPGDSLLFASGIWIDDFTNQFFHVHFSVIILMVIVASVLGNFAGYWFGAKYGHRLYERKDSFLFRKKHLKRAHDFYEKHGGATVFLAKFLPIVRTFVPIVAGIVMMNKRTFAIYNILGSILWVSIMILGGHYLQNIIWSRYQYSLKDHIDMITVIIVVITTLPVIIKLFTTQRHPPKAITNSERHAPNEK